MINIERPPIHVVRTIGRIGWTSEIWAEIQPVSANRGDKVNAVIALHTEDNTDKLAVIAQHNAANTNKLAAQSDQILDLQRQQIEMLKSLNGIEAAIDGIHARLADGPEG